MKTQHFGIEIEMTGITRSKAASLMATCFGTGEKDHEGGAYDTYTAKDEQGRTWKAMNDSSLQPQKKVGGRVFEAFRNCQHPIRQCWLPCPLPAAPQQELAAMPA